MFWTWRRHKSVGGKGSVSEQFKTVFVEEPLALPRTPEKRSYPVVGQPQGIHFKYNWDQIMGGKHISELYTIVMNQYLRYI